MSLSLLLHHAQHILFLLLGWFVRWETSGHIAGTLLGATSRICSKQHIVFLCSTQLFSKCFVRFQVV